MVHSDNISQAIKILRAGGLIAIPTETVYGLAADASNEEALQKIFIVKNRPENHPLIIHIAKISDLSHWAIDIPDSAYLLANVFWPGPLTLILKKAPHVSDLITGRQNTIGIRIPNHPITLELLNRFGKAVAAPSANRFGRISPTTPNAVFEELGDAVHFILSGGQSEIGVESTILDLTQTNPIILRPGMITEEQISKVLKKEVTLQKKNSIRVSGSFHSHYAPNTPANLIPQKKVEQVIQSLLSDSLPVVLLTRAECKSPLKDVHIVKMPEQAKAYAHELYSVLRAVDKQAFKQIIIEDVPNEPEWSGIKDRLIKATHRA